MCKRLFSAIFLVVILCFTAIPAAAESYSPLFPMSAKSYYLYNLDSNMVITDQTAHQRVQPSTLAQLMTMVVALEEVDNPDDTMVSMKGYIQDEMYRKGQELGGIPLAGLLKNEAVSVENLLYAMLLRNANEAAMMVADYVGDGSVPYFVEMMNQRAAELGMKDTHFTSPHGLPDEKSYTTAYDMALLVRHAMTLRDFNAIAGETYRNGGPTNLHENLHWNTVNRLVKAGDPQFNRAAWGIKSAYAKGLGSSVITIGKKGGYSYLAVVLGATSVDEAGEDTSHLAAYEEANALLTWAFDTFKVKTLLEKGKSFGEIPLRLSWGKDFLRVMSAEDFTALIPDVIAASSIRFEVELPESVNAPIEEGQLLGQVHLLLAEEEIGVVGIVSAEAAAVSRPLLLWQRVLDITYTYWFKFLIVLFLSLSALYFALAISHNNPRRRR